MGFNSPDCFTYSVALKCVGTEHPLPFSRLLSPVLLSPVSSLQVDISGWLGVLAELLDQDDCFFCQGEQVFFQLLPNFPTQFFKSLPFLYHLFSETRL